uniref:3-oxoacyl-[acyl-carrier protein] reductase n=1 Tax=Sphingomonas sp. JE1 TaxID=1628059 RepID=A0A0D4ZZE1_9SPHN|nr:MULTISPECIES: glucose 1-dehydrogenase [unclassified Sphingomonas]AJW29524.1 3-oxoacyl-[acyl-carrier protein] reductase [Sphingomonas sp. JE1]
MRLEGQVAIVTGAATGLGAAVAEGLATRGANVLVNYSRSKADAEAVVEQLRANGVDAIAVQGDVAEDADCRAIAAAALQRWGRIDILINNAAKTTRMAPHDDMEALQAEDFIASYRVNVIGAFQMIRACRSAMKAQGYGAVVNISSVSSLNGGGSSVAYTASKGALNTMSQSLARALGPEIRVNTVCPGFMATRWFTSSLGEDMLRAVIEKQENTTPLARAGKPEDVVPSILFLAAEGALHTTGAVIVVDAGFHLGPRPLPLSAKPQN